MPSLKDLRIRIDSVKSTQKITSAMKMVAAAKLRRAQEQAEQARPYAERLEKVLTSLANGCEIEAPLLTGTGKAETHLLVVVTSDRGLCGSYNATIVREATLLVNRLQKEGKEVSIICVGQKGRDALNRVFPKKIIRTIRDIAKPKLGYDDASTIANIVTDLLEEEKFDVCSIVYNKFKSAIAQIPTTQQLIPLPQQEIANDNAQDNVMGSLEPEPQFIYEPSEEEIVKTLLPKNLSVQIYKALLEGNASEHGARMTAMDNATRNAGDMIKGLTLQYNRSRQAHITRELIEIISGAEAL